MPIRNSLSRFSRAHEPRLSPLTIRNTKPVFTHPSAPTDRAVTSDEIQRTANLSKTVGSRAGGVTGARSSPGAIAWATNKRVSGVDAKAIDTKITGKAPRSSPSLAQSPFTSNKYSGELGGYVGIGLRWGGGKVSGYVFGGPIINRSAYGAGLKFDKDGFDLIGTKLGLKSPGKIKSKTGSDVLGALRKKKKDADNDTTESGRAEGPATDGPKGSGSSAPDGAPPTDHFGPPPTDDNKGGDADDSGPKGANPAMPAPHDDSGTDGLTGMKLGFPGRDQPKVEWAPKVPTGPATDPVDPIPANGSAPPIDPETGPGREEVVAALLPKTKARPRWEGPGGGDPDPNAPKGGGSGSEPADTATGSIDRPIFKIPGGIIDPSGW